MSSDTVEKGRGGEGGKEGEEHAREIHFEFRSKRSEAATAFGSKITQHIDSSLRSHRLTDVNLRDASAGTRASRRTCTLSSEFSEVLSDYQQRRKEGGRDC